MYRNRNGAKIVLSDGREFLCDIITDNAGDKSIDRSAERADGDSDLSRGETKHCGKG